MLSDKQLSVSKAEGSWSSKITIVEPFSLELSSISSGPVNVEVEIIYKTKKSTDSYKASMFDQFF